ncbi:MAG: hypothetical protein ACI9D0_001814 [Bacteroidia bacterium]|jgi:hypothetical protein
MLLAPTKPRARPRPCFSPLQVLPSARLGQFDEGRSSKTVGSAAWLLLVLVLLIGGACYVLLIGGDKVQKQGPLEGAPGSGVNSDAVGRSGSMNAPRDAGSRTSEAPAAVDESKRFSGMGSLRGFIQMTADMPLPATWTLVIEPSASLLGSELATSHAIEITGTDEFEVENLPLAGYSVHGQADGLNGTSVNVLLERTSSSAYVTLNLSPAGFIAGQLVDYLGVPLEGVAVWLTKGTGGMFAPQTGAVETSTLADGTWRFDKVLDGSYSVAYGSLTSPLIPPSTVSFRAPSLTMPAPELPPLSTFTIQAVDETGSPVTGARVRGSGGGGSAFDVTTNSNGEAILRHLRPGRYSVHCSHDIYGEAQTQRRFRDGENATVKVILVGVL